MFNACFLDAARNEKQGFDRRTERFTWTKAIKRTEQTIGYII